MGNKNSQTTTVGLSQKGDSSGNNTEIAHPAKTEKTSITKYLEYKVVTDDDSKYYDSKDIKVQKLILK